MHENEREDFEDAEKLEQFEVSTPLDEDIKKRFGCSFPLCGGGMNTRALIKELRTVQTNQKDQQRIWEQFLEHQAKVATMIASMVHFSDDLKKMDARISDAFRALEKKVDEKDIVPQTNIVLKSDMKWVIGYTIGGSGIMMTLIQLFFKATGKG